ncbi:unnamed protein product [Hydatigera taeniaeformis]|uniref:Mitochondrial cytochrome c oxidase subunit VIc/VIIs domain-containing protein n=1 Tax=Hydatigena taeniaeformis TaxID=6205 RepID=A0A0R3X4J9_HYDTA|nr:unnamed protein product [Hydatigera taeniaeformis]
MIFSRLPILSPISNKLAIIPRRNGAVLTWMKKNFAVSYLIFVVGSGLASLAMYTVTCLFRNPDIRLPFYDDKPRDEYYFNKHYFGASKNTDPRLPPVRMHYNGDLEFPYDNPRRKARTPNDI